MEEGWDFRNIAVCVIGDVTHTFYRLESGMRDLQFQGHPGTSHPRTPLSTHWIELPLGRGKKVTASYIISSEGGSPYYWRKKEKLFNSE